MSVSAWILRNNHPTNLSQEVLKCLYFFSAGASTFLTLMLLAFWLVHPTHSLKKFHSVEYPAVETSGGLTQAKIESLRGILARIEGDLAFQLTTVSDAAREFAVAPGAAERMRGSVETNELLRSYTGRLDLLRRRLDTINTEFILTRSQINSCLDLLESLPELKPIKGKEAECFAGLSKSVERTRQIVVALRRQRLELSSLIDQQHILNIAQLQFI